MRKMVLLATLLLTGCNPYGYRYAAVDQPFGSNVYGDYRESPGAIDVTMDTHTRKLVSCYMVGADGTAVKPTSIDLPVFKSESANVAFTADAMSLPRAQGPTVIHFDKAKLPGKLPGGPPYRFHAVLQGIDDPVVLVLGGARK